MSSETDPSDGHSPSRLPAEEALVQRDRTRQLLEGVLGTAGNARAACVTADACAGRRPCRRAAAESGDRTVTSTARPARAAPPRDIQAPPPRRISSSTAAQTWPCPPRYSHVPCATSARTRSSRSKYDASIHASLCQTCRSRMSSVENCAGLCSSAQSLAVGCRVARAAPRTAGRDRSSAADGRGRSSRRRTPVRPQTAHPPA